MISVVGGGGHGRDIAGWLGAQFAIYYDDDISRGAPLSELTSGAYLIGVWSSRVRARLAARLPDCTRAWVHERAVGPVDLQAGTFVAPGAIIHPSTRMGRHVHIGAGATIAQDCRLDDFVTVSPGAHICGDVTLRTGVMVGAGAVVKNLVTIGAGTTIGCGAAVVCDVPAMITVAGVPARRL